MKDTSFIIDRDAISHFTYHWFWGLRYHREIQANNLASELDEVMPRSIYKSSLLAQQQQVSQRHFIIRLFYWLFNIDNYALNTYKLAALELMGAYDPFDLPKETDTMKYDRARYFVYFPWRIGLPLEWAMQTFRRHWDKSSTEASMINPEDERALTIIEKRSSPNRSGRKDKTMKVQESMQPHLSVLEISRENRDFLSWRDVKKAYKAKLLVVHPDKGGDDSNFIELNDAYNRLEENFFHPKGEAGDEAIIALWRDFREINNKIDKLHKRTDETHETLDRVEASLEKKLHKLDKLEKRFDSLRQKKRSGAQNSLNFFSSDLSQDNPSSDVDDKKETVLELD